MAQPHLPAAQSHLLLPLISSKKPLLVRSRQPLTSTTPPTRASTAKLTQLLRSPTMPYISAQYWHVNVTGGPVFGHKDSAVVEVASLTKIMTLLVSVRLAERFEVKHDTQVVVSEVAARTPGTSAQLRSGESVTLLELLYGLMLPSGNDAAVALAEHFGKLLKEQTRNPAKEFVREMNRVAADFNLKHTTYQNPHGLSRRPNYSTAFDVSKLARAAMKYSLIRQIVNTQQYQRRTSRKVVWKNTNVLLSKGFCGVKTGVTTKAGPCVCVSTTLTTGQQLIVTVLSARSMDSRWNDVTKLVHLARLKHTN